MSFERRKNPRVYLWIQWSQMRWLLLLVLLLLLSLPLLLFFITSYKRRQTDRQQQQQPFQIQFYWVNQFFFLRSFACFCLSIFLSFPSFCAPLPSHRIYLSICIMYTNDESEWTNKHFTLFHVIVSLFHSYTVCFLLFIACWRYCVSLFSLSVCVYTFHMDCVFSVFRTVHSECVCVCVHKQSTLCGSFQMHNTRKKIPSIIFIEILKCVIIIWRIGQLREIIVRSFARVFFANRLCMAFKIFVKLERTFIMIKRRIKLSKGNVYTNTNGLEIALRFFFCVRAGLCVC